MFYPMKGPFQDPPQKSPYHEPVVATVPTCRDCGGFLLPPSWRGGSRCTCDPNAVTEKE